MHHHSPMSGAILAGALLAFVSGTAHGHAVFVEDTFVAGQTVEVGLRIAHGCEGSATRSVQVQMPNGPGVTPAAMRIKPRYTRQWLVRAQRGPVEPFESHGTLYFEDVTAIQWSLGFLPDAQYEVFQFRLTLPELPQGTDQITLEFPTVQQCIRGQNIWDNETVPNLTITAPEISEVDTLR